MDLKFKVPDFTYHLNSIMEFQKEGEHDYWNDSLYYFYPDLNKEYAYSLSFPDRCEYIGEKLEQVFEKNRELLNGKADAYQSHWSKYKNQITEAFSEAFAVDCEAGYQDIVGNITLNPICPRNLGVRSFDVFYLNSEKGALGNALHEMVHFVWFDVWRRHFGDNKEAYERPHLKWILSEMAVEPIMRDERLSTINPYFPRDYEKGQNGCVYGYFYTMEIEEKPILDTLYDMYQRLSITEFMEQAYEYCQKYEKKIRRHIEENE